MIKLRPSKEEIFSRFEYNQTTGLFIYCISVGGKLAGTIAGNKNTNGHIQIMIDEKNYLAHNLAWLYMTGEWPEGFIVDHKDRNYSNNKWNNLRKASLTQNQGNSKKRIDNASGYKGVHLNKRQNTYVAQITINGIRTYLGQSKDIEIAHNLYLEAARKHFGEFHND